MPVPDQRDLFPLLEEMYRTRSLGALRPICCSQQADLFQAECDILKSFGIQKEWVVREEKSQAGPPAVLLEGDGKVQTLKSVSLVRIKTVLRTEAGQRLYRKRVRNVFFMTFMVQDRAIFSAGRLKKEAPGVGGLADCLAPDLMVGSAAPSAPAHDPVPTQPAPGAESPAAPPALAQALAQAPAPTTPAQASSETALRCRNCGGLLEREGDLLHCPHCKATYRTEAEVFLLSGMTMTRAFRGLRNPLMALGLLFAGVCAYQAGALPFVHAWLEELNQLPAEQMAEHPIMRLLMGAVGLGLLSVLFRAIRQGRIHYGSIRRIRREDPHFSMALFGLRLEVLLKEACVRDAASAQAAFLIQSLSDLILVGWAQTQEDETVRVRVRVNGIALKRGGRRPKVRQREEVIELSLRRRLGVKTPRYYQPDQFTCPACGAHQLVAGAKVHQCAYCGKSIAADALDWVLAEDSAGAMGVR